MTNSLCLMRAIVEETPRARPAYDRPMPCLFRALLPLAVLNLSIPQSMTQQWALWSPPLAAMAHITTGDGVVNPLLALSVGSIMVIGAQVSYTSRPR